MQEFFTIISNFGFPVAVASYLLFRFEKKLEILEQSNRNLTDTIDKLTEAINDLSKQAMRVKK